MTRKLILKGLRFVPFGANMGQMDAKPTIPDFAMSPERTDPRGAPA